MKIFLRYNDLNITINSKNLEATIDAIQVTGDILDRFRQLGHGNPKMELHLQKTDYTKVKSR